MSKYSHHPDVTALAQLIPPRSFMVKESAAQKSQTQAKINNQTGIKQNKDRQAAIRA